MPNSILYPEKTRIETLKKYEILDTPPDQTFDEFTKLTATLLKVPIAIISMVDTDRIWFKSKYGLEISQVDRDLGLCASAILSNDFYEVQDTVRDVRTRENSLVTGKSGLRFYAAYPLETKKGHNLGTLCVMDKAPRKLSETEKTILKSLRNLVMGQLELRFSARTAYLNQNRMLSIFTHDLKNPLATINMAADIVQKKKDDPEIVTNMCGHIVKAGKNSLRIVEELLKSAQLNSGEIELHLSEFNIGELLEDVVESNKVLANKKGQPLILSIETESTILADKGKMEEIMDNLINNAIKYSPKKKSIKIDLREIDGHLLLRVKDEGLGFTERDKRKIFKRFSKLSARPTGNETSTGLGLYIVKNLVELHRGKIRVESNGENKGSCFIVEFPLEHSPSRKNSQKKRSGTSLSLND